MCDHTEHSDKVGRSHTEQDIEAAVLDSGKFLEAFRQKGHDLNCISQKKKKMIPAKM